MAALNETRNATIADASMASQGLLVMYHADGVKKTAAVTDIAVGVTAAESSRDAAGALEGSGVGTVAVFPLSGIVYVKSMAIASAKSSAPPWTCQSRETITASLITVSELFSARKT